MKFRVGDYVLYEGEIWRVIDTAGFITISVGYGHIMKVFDDDLAKHQVPWTKTKRYIEVTDGWVRGR